MGNASNFYVICVRGGVIVIIVCAVLVPRAMAADISISGGALAACGGYPQETWVPSVVPVNQRAASVSPRTPGAFGLVILTRAALGNEEYATNTPMPDITTQGDLRAYAAQIMHEDAHIQNLSLSPDSMSLTYDMPAKLFGFIPVELPLRVEMDAAGRTGVQYPWYRPFLSFQDQHIEITLQDSPDASGPNPSFSPQAQAAFVRISSDELSGRSDTIASSTSTGLAQASE